MRIVILQENGRHVANRMFRECFSCARALHSLGHDVSVAGLGHDLPDGCESYEELIATCDAVLSLEDYDSGWHPDLSAAKCIKFFWSRDSHLQLDRHLEFARHHRFDVVAVAPHARVDAFASLCDRAIWLPNAVDTALVFPTGYKSVPFGFCGTVAAGAERAATVKQLVDKYAMHVDDWVLGHSMVRAVSSYWVGWNRNLADDINYRTFETLACRTALVTNETPGLRELFDVEQDLFVYTDEASMHAAIRRAMADKLEAEMRANSGYCRVITRHTYLHRMLYLFGSVQ